MRNSVLRLIGKAAVISVGVVVAYAMISPDVLTAADLNVVGGNS